MGPITSSRLRGGFARGVTAAEILIAVVIIGILALGTSAVVQSAGKASMQAQGAANAALATNYIAQYAAAGQTTLNGVTIPAAGDYAAASITALFAGLNSGVSYTLPSTVTAVTLRLTPPEQNPSSYVGAYVAGQYVIQYSAGNP